MNLSKYVTGCVCTLMLVVIPSIAAADVTVLWDSNVEPDLAGYQIGYGVAPGQYTGLVDAGNRTSYSFAGLQAGNTYYFAVRAYNTGGLVSGFSAEVSAFIPAVAPLQLTNLVVNYPSPMPTGTRVVFGAAPTGGVAPYQYKWWVKNGAEVLIVQGWSLDNTLVWTPTKQGVYTVTVWARSAGRTADAPDNSGSARSMQYEIFRPNRRSLSSSEVTSRGDK
jgi:hypothetical protein